MNIPTSISRIFSQHPVLIASSSAGVLLVAIPVIRLVRLHNYLDHVITNFYSLGTYAKEAARSSPQAQLPGSVSSNPDEYQIFYDVATKSMQKSLLPDCGYEEMLTMYLRRNMIAFSALPQAYIMKLMASKEARPSFDKEYLSTVKFVEGDLVNGSYRVLKRDGGLCVFSIFMGGVESRLVVSIEDEVETLDGETGVWMSLSQINVQGKVTERKMTMFKNETFTWVPNDGKAVMPMESYFPRWAHETALWWMMDGGTKWLCDMKGGREKQA